MQVRWVRLSVGVLREPRWLSIGYVSAWNSHGYDETVISFLLFLLVSFKLFSFKFLSPSPPSRS